MSVRIVRMARIVLPAVLFVLLTAPLFAAGAREQAAVSQEITLYSGRGESLVDPLIRRFEAETGIRVRVRYAGTAELAVLLAEEGDRTPADLFWGQDAGALGSLANDGLLAELPASLLADKPEIYVSATGQWVATSGRARVLAYSPQRVASTEFPASVFDLPQARYRSRVGWAPTNGSFQAFVTAMRVTYGDARTGEWLTAMRANDAQAYRNNTALVEAIAAGEIDFAITNNYYLLRFLANDAAYPVSQRFFADGDIGNLVNVASVGVLRSSTRFDAAVRFVEFLVQNEAQRFFTDVIYEYPVLDSVSPSDALESFESVLNASPRLNLDDLSDLQGTLTLLRNTGVL